MDPDRTPQPRVLIIDDEAPIRMALRRYFTRKGWAAEEAEDGGLGLEKLLAAPLNGFDVIITDLTMPGVSGTAVHDRLEAERPDLLARLILSSGDVTAPQAAALTARSRCPVLSKPFEFATLDRVVAEVMTRATGSV